MPVNYPKFDKKIQDQIENFNFQQNKSRSGIIASFNYNSNTVNVILDNPNTGEMGSILTDVPYPSTKGVQTVAPLLGTRCMVMFRGRNESEPYIVGVYDAISNLSDKMAKTKVKTGIPRFMVSK